MPEVKDDPHQVLMVLNSLGFVGITAEQLKGFMKDLKIYRKIKDRERQLCKQEMKRRIVQKQEEELAKWLMAIKSQETPQGLDESLVEIKIQCILNSDPNEVENNISKQKTEINRNLSSQKTRNAPIHTVNISNNAKREAKVIGSMDTPRHVRATTSSRSVSAPDLLQPMRRPSRSKSTSSEPTKRQRSARNSSRCSSRSQPKSFIRPWKLNPESQPTAQITKSDPVALYRNYQKQWGQISFPGENRHADIRWAVREKMLGVNPNPTPILKRSCSPHSVKQ